MDVLINEMIISVAYQTIVTHTHTHTQRERERERERGGGTLYSAVVVNKMYI